MGDFRRQNEEGRALTARSHFRWKSPCEASNSRDFTLHGGGLKAASANSGARFETALVRWCMDARSVLYARDCEENKIKRDSFRGESRVSRE